MVHISNPKSKYLISSVAFIHQSIEETDVLDPERIDRLVPYFKALATTIQTYRLTDFAVTTTHPIPKTKNKQPLIPKEETFTGNVRIIDKNGETLWFRGEGIANELHRGIEGYEPIEITNERVGARLNSIYPAYPDASDSRHPQQQYHKDQGTHFEKQGLPSGTHHFLHLHEQGQKNNQTAKRAARWCQTMCEDTFGGCAGGNPNRKAKGEAVKTWFEETKETEVAVGLWYSVVEPEAFAKQQEFRQWLVDEDTGLTTHSRFQVSTLQVRVENQGAEPHKDGGDADNSFTCWTAHGIGAGSVDVCFPELGHRVKVLGGDIIGCRASLLDHCVSELKDPRGIILYAMKQRREDMKQHVNFLPDGPERDAILAAKAARDKLKHDEAQREAEEECRRIQRAGMFQENPNAAESEESSEGQGLSARTSGLEHDYRRAEVPKYPNKLRKAFISQRKAIKAMKRNGVSTSEITDAEERPASDFYEYGRKEQARRCLGLNPFGDKMPRRRRAKRT